MSVLRIITHPDPILKRISSPVTTIDSNLQEFMKSMVETMNESNGCGLAAVQVGLLKKIFVIDISPNNDQPMFFINPEITYFSESKELQPEACLSFPDAGSKVMRHAEIEVKFLDYYGQPQQLKANGLLAQVIQHENDHLNGIVYTDHLSLIEGMMIKKKVKKALSQKKEN